MIRGPIVHAMTMTQTHRDNLMTALKHRATEADVFASIRDDGQQLICDARDAGAPAEYAVTIDTDTSTVWVILRTADRWLSESIEADLMHTGDKLDELIEDELTELDCSMKITFEHFRDDDLRYTFRTPIRLATGQAADDPIVIEQTAACLLAYEAAFRELGDMSPDES